MKTSINDLEPGNIIYTDKFKQKVKFVGKSGNLSLVELFESKEPCSNSWYNDTDSQQGVLKFGLQSDLGKIYGWIHNTYDKFTFIASSKENINMSKNVKTLKPGDILYLHLNNKKVKAKFIGRPNDNGLVEILDEEFGENIIKYGGWFNNLPNHGELTNHYKIKTDLNKYYKWLFSHDIYEIEKPESNFKNQFVNDLSNAGYRVASTQISSAIKNLISSSLEKEGFDEGKLKIIKEIFDTQFGNALISYIIGQGLTYIPNLKNNDKIISLAKEFRVNGMSVAGNEIVDALIQYILPAITDTLNLLPKTNDIDNVLNNEENIILEEKAKLNYE